MVTLMGCRLNLLEAHGAHTLQQKKQWQKKTASISRMSLTLAAGLEERLASPFPQGDDKDPVPFDLKTW